MDGRIDDNDDHRSVGGRESEFESGYFMERVYIFIYYIYQHDGLSARPTPRPAAVARAHTLYVTVQGGKNATAN